MDQGRETLGRYLKRERESHRVSVEEVALFLGTNRSSIDALEGDDFDLFDGRSECVRLVKRYAAYLKLNNTEVLRLFDAEWNLTGRVKRYPKLTQFADGDSSAVGSARFKIGKLGIGHLPARRVWFSLGAGVLIVIAVLFMDLPGTKWELTPTDQPQLAEKSIEASSAKGDRVIPPASDAEERTEPVNRVARPEAPRPRPGVAEGKPAPPPAAGARVVGNRDSKRYHLPGMKYYDQVKAYHRVVFPSEKDAIRAGYRRAPE